MLTCLYSVVSAGYLIPLSETVLLGQAVVDLEILSYIYFVLTYMFSIGKKCVNPGHRRYFTLPAII